ncbi:MAG: sodium/glutamate symporter, partial [Verrucomicrobiota bacterium]
VASGLLISFLVLAGNLSGLLVFKLGTKVDENWWNWLVATGIDLKNNPKLDVYRPFQVAFFTCIGLNASWALAKRGGLQAIFFLVLATLFALLQNIVGVVTAKLLGVAPLLGVICGAVTLTGGHGTATGFADEFIKAGMTNAKEIGMAAATFGLIAGGLLGGSLGGALIRKNKLQPTVSAETHLEMGANGEPGIWNDFKRLKSFRGKWILHLLLILVCIKLGAWISYFMQQLTIPMPMVKASFSPAFDFAVSFEKQKLSFPTYIGAMLLGVVLRNIFDAAGVRWIKTEVVDVFASVSLGIFLTIAMMSLSLIDLAAVAKPMVVILLVQIMVMALFAWFVIFRAMGRDYDAAVMAGGHCGFGLGATSNAIASMKTLVENFGPAPRAFLIIPIVGAFLIDFPNALIITLFLNLAK